VEEVGQECFCGCGRTLAWADRPRAKDGARVIACLEFLNAYAAHINVVEGSDAARRLEDLVAEGRLLRDQLQAVIHGEGAPTSVDGGRLDRWLQECRRSEHAAATEGGAIAPPGIVVPGPEAPRRSSASPSLPQPAVKQSGGVHRRRRTWLSAAVLGLIVAGATGAAVVAGSDGGQEATSEATGSTARPSPTATTAPARPQARKRPKSRPRQRDTVSSGGRTFSCPVYATDIDAAKLRIGNARRRQRDLNAEIEAIQSRYPGGTAPPSVVDRYNTMVDRYNAQVPRINALIDRYNRLLQEQCIPD
jgi:hypothetical protein